MDNMKTNPLNDDNVIFKSRRKFKYKYNAKDKRGNVLHYFFKFDKRCFTGKNIDCFSWEIIQEDSISKIEGNECYHKIDYLELTVFESIGHTSLSNSQTIIKYEYFNNEKGRISYGEATGIIEDSLSVFIHPPRSFGFIVTEFNPFPKVKLPLEIGKTWQGSIAIPTEFVREIIPDYSKETSIGFHTEYEVENTFYFKNPYDNNSVKCYKIHASNDGEIGKTYADFYFNKDYGFMEMNYINYDSSELSLKLVNITDDTDN